MRDEDKDKDDSYTEYYKIKSNIELHKQQIQKELKRLEALAKKHQHNIETPQVYQDTPKTKKQKYIETGIIIAIFIIVLGAIAWVTLAGLFPDVLPFGTTGYSILAEDSKILQGSLSEFYIDDTSVLGDKMTYQGRTIRPITSSKKFNLVFKPARTIQPTTGTLTLNLVILNNSNIYLDDELIFPNLDNYEMIEETSDGYYVYARKDIMPYVNRDELIESDSASRFLYENFPSSSVWSTSELEAINPEVEGYEQEWTEINTTFRGDLHLAVYAEDNLNIKFVKQDLNWYIGNDEYTINITDYKGDLVFTQTYQDDGINEKGSLGEEQAFEINKEVDKGVYYVDFVADENNQADDLSLKTIEINSNKVLMLGRFLPIEPFSFYTKTIEQETIGFLYWHSNMNQLITVKGEEKKVIDLNEELFEQKYETNLTKGEYIINLEKGDLWVYSDIVSISKDSWFNLPPITISKFNNQDFLIIDSYTYDHYNKILFFENEIYFDKNGEGKFSFRALEPGAVGVESVNLEIG
jgi:hypothetical protein